MARANLAGERTVARQRLGNLVPFEAADHSLLKSPHALSSVSCCAEPGVIHTNQVLSSTTPVTGTPAQVCNARTAASVSGPNWPSIAPE